MLGYIMQFNYYSGRPNGSISRIIGECVIGSGSMRGVRVIRCAAAACETETRAHCECRHNKEISPGPYRICWRYLTLQVASAHR